MGGLSLGVGGVGGGVDGGLSQKRKGRVGLGGLEAPNGTGPNGDVSANGGLRIGVNGGGGVGDWGELDVDGDGDGGETPRIGFNKNWEGERFLESLRCRTFNFFKSYLSVYLCSFVYRFLDYIEVLIC